MQINKGKLLPLRVLFLSQFYWFTLSTLYIRCSGYYKSFSPYWSLFAIAICQFIWYKLKENSSISCATQSRYLFFLLLLLASSEKKILKGDQNLQITELHIIANSIIIHIFLPPLLLLCSLKPSMSTWLGTD